MGGKVSVSSVVGQYTKFKIVIKSVCRINTADLTDTLLQKIAQLMENQAPKS